MVMQQVGLGGTNISSVNKCMFDLFSSSSEMFYHMQVRGDEANKAHVQVNGHEIKDKIQHCMLASV